jgi:hypothetical protein
MFLVMPPVKFASLLASAALAATLPAAAGPRPYGYLQGFDGLPSGGAELESWFSASRPSSGTAFWDWWIGTTVGVTDRVEAGLFAILVQPPRTSGPASLALGSLRLPLSVQLADKASWPIDLRVRAELGIPTVSGRSTTAWLTAIASRDQGILNLTANAGAWWAFGRGTTATYIDGGLGASLLIGWGLRAGGELNFDFELGEPVEGFAGGSLAWAAGRFWASAAFGPGLGSGAAQTRGRVIVGLAF